MGNCVIQIICELLACAILLSLRVSGNTNGSEPLCVTTIKVPRNTQFRALVMTELQINCTVIINKCEGNPKISWCRIDGNDCKALNKSNYTKTMWKNKTQNYGIAFLMFLNISMDDAGLYRCKTQNSVSHAINVSVTEHEENSGSGNQNNTSNKTGNQEEGLQWLWPYVYICGGLVGLVVIVITVSLFIIRCQGRKSARKVTTTNQYVKTQRSAPTTPSHPHHNTHPPSTRLTSAVYSPYDTPPVRAGLHRDRPSAERLSANMTEACRNNVRSTEEEENPLVYASLNHQAISRGPRRTVEQETEPSEYAAIRYR